jgi:hypothetical protein
MKRYTGWLVGAVLMGTLIISGCSSEEVQPEAGKYNIQALPDGVLRAQSQGKGVDVQVLRDMRQSFARENMLLTHERYAEDARGNVSYQYLINNQPSQQITLHVFSSEQELINRVPHWYRGNQVVTSTNRTEVYNNHNTSLVYTSMGKEKGKYSPQIKVLFTSILRRLDMQQNPSTAAVDRVH